MKILWVAPAPIGPAGRILGLNYSGSSGVWIQTAYEEMLRETEAQIVFLCGSPEVPAHSFRHEKTEEGEAYAIHRPKLSQGRTVPEAVLATLRRILAEVKPDLIHIWGTETCIQHAAAVCAGEIPCVVFLQGLIGIHRRYQGGSLKKLGLPFPMSAKERAIGLLRNHFFNQQAEKEQEILRLSDGAILDSDFAAAYCKAVSENIRLFDYHLDSNVLFTRQHWTLEDCARNTVFTVYGAGPDKGLHQLVRAAAIVKKAVPSLRVIVPGSYHTAEGGRLADRGLSAYERLLKGLITAGGLEDTFCFCGKLTQPQMAEQLKACHLFVNPSAMEVHAGAVREAMTVGIPSISSYCGSVGEYIREGENGFLYRYEEHEVLAYKMLKLLTDDARAAAIGAEGRKTMLSCRNEVNERSLMRIYRALLDAKAL